MNLKNKANMIGNIAIMSGATSFVLLLFSMFYEIKYVQVGVFALTMLYSEMKLKYIKLRQEEIDELLKNR